TTGRIRQAVREYRIANRKKQYFWVKESLYAVNIGGIEYLESTTSNITSTRNAIDQLRAMNAAPKTGSVPDFNLQTVVKYADLHGFLQTFTIKSGVGAMMFNNAGALILQNAEITRAWDIIKGGLEGFESFNLTPVLKSKYSDLTLAVHPIERRGARVGTLLLYGRLSGVAYGARLVNDLGLFPPVLPGQLESLYKYAGIFADSLAYMIEVATLASLQIMSVSTNRVDIERERKIREVFIDVNEAATAAGTVQEAFRNIAKLIGPALQLSRMALASFGAHRGTFSILEEWNDETVTPSSQRVEGLDIGDIFLAEWKYETDGLFVINTPDVVIDPSGSREHAHAAVGVRLMKNGTPWGFVTFVDNQSRRIWNDKETFFIENIGTILSASLVRDAVAPHHRGGRTDFIRILDSLPSAVAIVATGNASILYSNVVFTDLFLRREQTVGGLRGEAYVRSILAVEPTTRAVKEIYLKDVDRWFIVNRSPVDYGDARDAELVILTDITVNKKTQETISSLAYSDVLTGLPNRSKLEADLRKTFELSSAMYTNSFIGVLNIDNFKLINNMYSYSFGDALLKTISIHLNKIPEIRDKIYRFGGDEFAFLVKNLYGEQVYEVAHKVMRVFESPFYIEGYETSCTVSLGIAFLNDANKDPDDLIRKANLALSDSKVSGKNKFILYDVSLQKFQEDTVSLERALKGAVDEGCGEFKVYYQPIIDAKSGKIVAAEALTRWFSDEYGFVSPVKFIPVAEQTGLIIPLGKYILNAAIKEAKKWLDYGLDISVSVNFSVIQILQTDLVQTLLKALQTYKLPAKNLIFEITESLAVNDINKIIEILSAVKQIGVRIAMDDFGTGYSSLNHLRRMPLDIVKIDRSFIFNIEFDPYTVSFVDTIAKFCHMKGTKICCEGIENETQKTLLKSVNVDNLQGYLFGKPAPADEFWKRLTSD
ncbi:MAG: EAL domain-containing protein, partial [Bacillota bacterium]|nr:EAL domain-containing protein [Bacillota bacterium]